MFLFLLFLFVTAQAQFLQSCNISQTTTTIFNANDLQVYTLNLRFNGTVSFSSPAGTNQPGWARVRERFRITLASAPDIDLILRYEMPDVNNFFFDSLTLAGSTLRMILPATVAANETVIVSYWKPPITPFSLLLVNGSPVTDFSCSTVMPNNTRLIGQVTTVTDLASGIPTYNTIVLTFSQPVSRCDTGGALRVNEFAMVDGTALSLVCTGMASVYDDRVWYCTGFTPSATTYFTAPGLTETPPAILSNSNVCDKASGQVATSDSRAPVCYRYQLVDKDYYSYPTGQAYALNSTSRAIVAVYEPCGMFPPINTSVTSTYFTVGPAYHSQYMWYPIAQLVSLAPPYYLSVPQLNVNQTLRPASYNNYDVIAVARITQSYNATTGLRIRFTPAGRVALSVVSYRLVLIAQSVNASGNALDYGILESTSGGRTYRFPTWTSFRNDLYGYITTTSSSMAMTFAVAYSQPINVTTLDPDPLLLLNATLQLNGDTLRLVFNNKLPLLGLVSSAITYSCGSIVSYNLTDWYLDLNVSVGICPNATLFLTANLTWTTEQWFSANQVFSAIGYSNLTLTDAVLFNGTFLQLTVAHERNTSDLFLTPASLRLTCNGTQTATVYPNGSVTGCNTSLGVRLSVLGQDALTDGVRVLTQLQTDWVVFATSDPDPTCPNYQCPAQPSPSFHNDFWQLSIGWKLGAILIPGGIAFLIGLGWGLWLFPHTPHQFHYSDIIRVG